MKIVKFNNDEVLTTLHNNKLYISVRDICKNLLMTRGQIMTQIQKVQRDETLKQGCMNFHAGVFDPNNATLGIELEFLPIWLAKINPARFNENLKKKLLDYQLHCKDILADEFFGKRELVLPDRDDERVNPYLNDIEDRIPIIRSLEADLIKLHDELQYHYNWIDERANAVKDKYSADIKEIKETNFTSDGKKLTTEDIDKLNGK